ncbi:MAG: hypothetical protein Q9160_005304 [Pyrenula sp. 1 TL-2023]
MATSATSLFLSTDHLLELVLGQLDMQTLLLSQRVSRTWQRVIIESASLQQNLFFQPKKTDPTVSDSDVEYVFNPLLAKVFPPFFTNRTLYSKHQFTDLLNYQTTLHEVYLAKDAESHKRLRHPFEDEMVEREDLTEDDEANMKCFRPELAKAIFEETNREQMWLITYCGENFGSWNEEEWWKDWFTDMGHEWLECVVWVVVWVEKYVCVTVD